MSNHLVLHTDWHQHPLDDEQLTAFEKMGVEVFPLISRTKEGFCEIAGQADAVLNSDFRITADLFPALGKCRLISRYGTGVDNIDVKAATRFGIPVANVPDFCTDAVADRTILLLLSCCGNLLTLDRHIRRGSWGIGQLPFSLEVSGKVLGLIGFGKIGHAVARRAQAFGMRVFAYDPYLEKRSMDRCGVVQTELEPLLSTADFVSLHLPLTQETWHLLNAARITLMKPTSILVNTARGALVDENALVRALKSGRLRAAGLDVFEIEPPSSSNPLFELENVTLTPHCAAHTEPATRRVRQAAVRAVTAVLNSEWPTHIVNPETLSRGS